MCDNLALALGNKGYNAVKLISYGLQHFSVKLKRLVVKTRNRYKQMKCWEGI